MSPVLTANPGKPEHQSARARLLRSLLELFDDTHIPYCILHGYERYPAKIVSDVDCLMPAEFLPRRLAALLRRNPDRLGAAVVQWVQYKSTGHCFVLAIDGGAPQWEFLALDVTSDLRGYGRVFYRGEEILASRLRHRGLWVPSAALEFGCYLVKKVGKCSLTDENGGRLTQLYHQDPRGCDREIARFWHGGSADRIRRVAASGEWATVRKHLPALRRELVWPGTIGEFRSSIGYWARDALRGFRRWREPAGMHVAVLGVDGSGKSTIVRALGAGLAPAFRRVTSKHLAPALFRGPRVSHPVSRPHGQRPRSLLGSLAKAALWILDYSLGYYGSIRPAVARSALVLFDRYFIDTLVDPTRYRYRGPRWVLQLIWSLIPKPDLVILLDAPTELVHTRKQEVSRVETERQRWAYKRLVETLPAGHVVDAAQSLDRVVTAAGAVVLDCLASRTMRRLHDPRQLGRAT